MNVVVLLGFVCALLLAVAFSFALMWHGERDRAKAKELKAEMWEQRYHRAVDLEKRITEAQIGICANISTVAASVKRLEDGLMQPGEVPEENRPRPPIDLTGGLENLLAYSLDVAMGAAKNTPEAENQ